MRRPAWLAASLVLSLSAIACRQAPPAPNSVTMLIESSPANLDPRIGTDGQSEHIDALIFDALVRRDAHFNVQPWLAESWQTPDPLTYIFHLHTGVRFHDGRTLTSRDVKWTLDTILHGPIITSKAGAFQNIAAVEIPDETTVIIRLKKPDAALLWNLSDGAIGIVPAGSGRDFSHHPIGSGPFRFVSMEQDKEVILARSETSWQPQPSIDHIRFAVVPDAITRALELEKGSADVCVNALTADMVNALKDRPQLVIQTSPGTVLNYISFNVADPALRDVRVRQAIAYAINRPLIVHSLWRDRARLAESLLPPDHWAWSPNLPRYDYSPDRANALLDAAGLPRDKNGIRFHITFKSSTDETSRLLAMILQQELRQIGIAARHPQLSSSPASTPTSRAEPSRCTPCAGKAAMRILTSSATPTTPIASRRMAPIADATSIPHSISCSTMPDNPATSSSDAKTTTKSSRSSPAIFLPSISGISIP